MNLSDEFKEEITQSLLDTYNIKCISIDKIGMEKVEKDYFIRHSFKGDLENSPFLGSLNFFLQPNGDCSFNISGWFANKSKDFMKSITKNNSYLQAIEEVRGWLNSNFDQRINIQTGCYWMGMGSLNYQRGSINKVVINMTPSAKGKITLVLSSSNKFNEISLLNYSFFEEDNKSKFNYITEFDVTSCSPVDVANNNVDLEKFKKRLLREYMLKYSGLTGKPNILSFDDFNTLSYQNIIDYLIVQKMQEI